MICAIVMRGRSLRERLVREGQFPFVDARRVRDGSREVVIRHRCDSDLIEQSFDLVYRVYVAERTTAVYALRLQATSG